MARFTPATPEWTPLSICDARSAWTGSLGESFPTPVRIEAAAWRGKPVYFQIIGPWTRATRMQSFQIDTRDEPFVVVALALREAWIEPATPYWSAGNTLAVSVLLGGSESTTMAR